MSLPVISELSAEDARFEGAGYIAAIVQRHTGCTNDQAWEAAVELGLLMEQAMVLAKLAEYSETNPNNVN